jgi:hypothetical protein
MIKYSELTKRGEVVVGIVGVSAILAMIAIAGAVETQDVATCNDYQQSQNWQEASDNSCPFTDKDGNYLYTWEVEE